MPLNDIFRTGLVHQGRSYVPLLTYAINKPNDEHFQVDDDSEDDDSGSDIRSGPPRKRRKHVSSARGKSSTTLFLCCQTSFGPINAC